MNTEKIIKGEEHIDVRGKLIYFNEFNMSSINRMYKIKYAGTSVIRGWQGHKLESKWLHCVSDEFIIKTAKLNYWEKPESVNFETYILNSQEPSVLFVSGGYIISFKVNINNSEILIFSDKTVKESEKDDYCFDISIWSNWDKL